MAGSCFLTLCFFDFSFLLFFSLFLSGSYRNENELVLEEMSVASELKMKLAMEHQRVQLKNRHNQEMNTYKTEMEEERTFLIE